MIFDILYESCPWHTRVALFHPSGSLLALKFDDASRPLIEGTIVRGRVRKVSQPLKAAFVDIGDVRDAFLPLSMVPPHLLPLTEGQSLIVRIMRAADNAKGARLDARGGLKNHDHTGKAPEVLAPPPNALRRALMEAGGDYPVRVWVARTAHIEDVSPYVSEDKIFFLENHDDVDFYERVDDTLADLQSHIYPLPGGQLSIEITKALVAIDVDASGELEPLAVNLQAAGEVARLCSLLDLGGNVMVDFVTLNNRQQRQAVTQALEDEFTARDMARVDIRPMSRFGLVEIHRERRGMMLPELMQLPDYIAGKILLHIWRQSVTGAHKELTVQAAPQVAALLYQRLTTEKALALLGYPVQIMEQPDWPQDRYTIHQ